MHIYFHSACLLYRPPPDPAYAPKRLKTVVDALRRASFEKLVWHEDFAPSTKEDLRLAHTAKYVDDILRPLSSGEQRAFASDTIAVEGTDQAILHAAGSVMAATRDVIAGKADRAFCLVSPGGHHAEADAAMGFCFVNTIAMSGIAAQKRLGLERVAVVDFDAHHGNGIQSLFWNFEDRLYISLHEDTHQSGFAHETGAWNNVLNIPLPKNGNGSVFRAAYIEKVAPKLEAFKPDMLFISAGFDMHADDPLSSMRLQTDDFRWIGKTLRRDADRLCGGRLVAVLEGGYILNALGASAAAFVEGMDMIP